jgi:PST family polysaccharide transporter
MSILNGQKEIKKYILVNIASSIFSLFFTSFLIMQLNLMGALYALVVNQSVIFFVTLVFVVKSNWFKLEYFKQGLDKESLSKLSRYSLMAITSALTVPVSHLIIREYIGENLGWDSAGYWQGIWYISTMYLMLVTTTLDSGKFNQVFSWLIREGIIPAYPAEESQKQCQYAETCQSQD